MKILVTGANGFVGSHILSAINKLDDVDVIAACRNKSKLPSWYTGEVRTGDLCDDAYSRNVIKDVDVVCHAAAFSSIFKHKEESYELYRNPSLKLLNNCVEQGVSKFQFISTTSASAPSSSNDPLSRGINREYWPHLGSVIAIEEAMRQKASKRTTMVVLRCGIFSGNNYGLGILPLLLPRLKTYLVPWVNGGRTSLPLIDGEDIGQAFMLAAINTTLSGYEAFNVVGPTIPTTREVLTYINTKHKYPKPLFGVPFNIAYIFAWLMETIDPLVPWNPLIVRSIVHLLEEVNVNNSDVSKRLNYKPMVNWKDSVDKTISSMKKRQKVNMGMSAHELGF